MSPLTKKPNITIIDPSFVLTDKDRISTKKIQKKTDHIKVINWHLIK